MRTRARLSAGPDLDVTFYMPSATPLLAPTGEPPAGGAEGQVLLLAQRFVQLGLRVAIIAHDPQGTLPSEHQGIRLIGQREVTASGPLARIAKLYVRGGSLLRGRAAVFVQRAAGPHTGLVAIAARLLRRRFVYSSANVIDFDYGRITSRRRNVWLFRLGVLLAHEVVVQTPEQVELCRQRFGREPVLIKSVAEPAARRRGVPEAFLWIGRLAQYKQPMAYVELARALPHAQFWMVAVPSGPDAPGILRELEEAARRQPNLELLAPRPKGELQPLIEQAVAMVNTSDYEGMPNVLLEGWSRGVPALALHHDPDGVIRRERIGEFAAGSHQRLAELAAQMWDNRADQAEVGDRCQAYIEREHAPDAIASRWAAMFKRLTAGA
jgi:glycosyltransferase involved in cell wall biosynthesis